ncbi:DHA2 family efflux MFS transporter permease subunit [Streptomyces sp. NPDC059248]|uniref:DHA2 family efflux MFS transporter permease subunit n=1 Tax=Streptomyces sp. NPDC059248 TaxID=3346791 RepID=UPI0036CAA16A
MAEVIAVDRRWWALGALVTCVLVLGFDLTILNVALPTIAADLGASTGEAQWTADAYIVFFAALMLPAGLAGDRFGRRRTLLAGLGIFLAGSVLGAFADDVTTVVAARAVMGVGGAFVMPLALSVLPTLFPEPAERTKAVGVVSAASALGMPLGPILGGWLLDHFRWGAIFLVNVPMVAIGIGACLLLLPESRDPAAPRVDPVATAATVLGLGALVFGVIEAPVRGWGDPLVIGAFALGVAAVAGLVGRERRSARPMLDLPLLSDRRFLLPALTATLVTLIAAGLLFTLPLHLQAVLGYDALGTGLRMLPLMLGPLAAAKAAGPLAARFGPYAVMSGGLAVLAFAAFLGSRGTADDGYGFVALWLSVLSVGFGFAIVPAMDAAIGSLSADRAGSGSGLLMTLRQAGAAVGVALFGSLLASVFAARIDTSRLPDAIAARAEESVVAAHGIAAELGDPALAGAADAAFSRGMSLTLLVCGIIALAAALAAPAPRREGDALSTGDGTTVDAMGADAPQ